MTNRRNSIRALIYFANGATESSAIITADDEIFERPASIAFDTRMPLSAIKESAFHTQVDSGMTQDNNDVGLFGRIIWSNYLVGLFGRNREKPSRAAHSTLGKHQNQHFELAARAVTYLV
jgi:hypothetical protein